MFRTIFLLVCLALVVAELGSSESSQHETFRDKRQDALERWCWLPQPMKNGRYSPRTTLCSPNKYYTACNNVPGTIVVPGWEIFYDCDNGYSLENDITMSTCEDGEWSPPLPQCVASRGLCAPLKSENMKISYTFQGKEVSDEGQMRPGTIAVPKCEVNYRPAYNPGYSNLTCLDNGAWDQQLFYCTAECGASRKVGLFTPLIFDGEQAYVGAFPWHAGLYYRHKDDDGRESWAQQCGGTLISDSFVLTAAHCIMEVTDVNNLRVALGKYYRSWDILERTEQKRNVTEILAPREFSRLTLIFDIALLRLDKKIKPGEFIMPVCHGFLDGTSYIKDKDLYVVGWGKTEDGKSSETLLYNRVEMSPSYECHKKAPSVFPMFDKFCAAKNSSDVSIAQQGDSGGGVTAVIDGLYFIFGLISLRFTNDNQYTYFSNITWPFNMIWMEGEIKKHHPSFTWLKSENQVQHQNSSCTLPIKSANRRFCSLADGCKDCTGACVIPPGSEAIRVRVVCDPEYKLRGSVVDIYSGDDVALCLQGGLWYPRVPECIKITGKKYIAGDPWTPVSWNDAMDNCKAKGRRLAVVKSSDDQTSFEDVADAQFKVTGESSSSIWIGLKEKYFSENFEWSNGRVLRHEDFCPFKLGEPNGLPHLLMCVQAVPNKYPPTGQETLYEWEDVSCSDKNFYFCQQKNSANKFVPGDPWKKVTWFEAKGICERNGFELPSIFGRTQQVLFEESVLNKFNQTGTERGIVWVGLKSIDRKFKWTDDTYLGSAKAGYTNWLPGEPSDGGGEGCVQTEGHSNIQPKWPNGKHYQWNDNACYHKRYYFCEDKTDSAQKVIIPGDPWKKVKWEEAKENCEKNGKQLATLKNSDQQERFWEVAANQFTNMNETPSTLWLGLRETSWDERFRWVNGLEWKRGDFSKWWPNQPNNAAGQENCVQAEPETGSMEPGPDTTFFWWEDNLCKTKNYFFCSEKGPNNTFIAGYPWKKVKWQDAKEFCQAKGYQLAVILNDSQQEKFEEAASQQFRDTNTKTDNIWIGLGSEGREFRWVDDTPLGRFSDWLTGEPGGTGEHCVEVVADEDNKEPWPGAKPYQWNDGECRLKKYYMCEEDTVTSL